MRTEKVQMMHLLTGILDNLQEQRQQTIQKSWNWLHKEVVSMQ